MKPPNVSSARSGDAAVMSLVGRGEEVAAGERFLRASAGGPAVLVIEGDPGIGKTILWRTILRDAADSGRRILISRPTESEADLSFVALTDLLSPLVDEVRRLLSPPERRALDEALLRTDPGDEPIDLRALGMAVSRALTALAEQPTIIAIDDLHWIDGGSARALEFAIRRLGAAQPLGFLVARRAPASDGGRLPIERLLPDDLVEHRRIGPITLGTLHRLIEQRLGVSLARPALLHLERASGGNPLLAIDVVDALRRAGRTYGAEDLLPVPAEVAKLVAQRLDGLLPRARRLIFTAAALDRPSVELLRRMAGSAEVTASLPAAIEAGLVEVDGDRVRFVHPLYRSAVYRAEPDEHRRRLHRRLAALADDGVEAARHAALGAKEPDSRAATSVATAASDAHRRGALDAAATLFEHALRLTDTADRGLRADREMALARVLWDVGDLERSRIHLSNVLADAAPGPTRALALVLKAMHLLWSGGEAAALPVYSEALANAGDDAALQAVIHMRIAYAADHDLELAAKHAADAVRLLESVPGAELSHACASMMLTNIELTRGRPYDADAVNMARARLDGPTPLFAAAVPFDYRSIARERGWLVRAARDELSEARAELEAVRREADESGHDRAAPIILCDLAELSCWLADPTSAREQADAALELVSRTGRTQFAESHAFLADALVAAHVGDLAVAARAAHRAGQLANSLGPGPLADRCQVVLGQVELALGRPAEAATAFAEVKARLEAAGVGSPALYRFRGDHIESLVLAGRLDDAAIATTSFEAAVERAPTPWGRAVAGRSRALLSAAQGDVQQAVTTLQQVVAHHDDLPMPVELGRTFLHLGRLRRRQRQKRSAADAIGRSLEMFERAGATGWVNLARRELRRIGSPPPSVDELTATELEVARLAATGLTNRQVAEAMVLSPKSIDGALTRIYAKLAIHSRAELGARMGSAPLDKEG